MDYKDLEKIVNKNRSIVRDQHGYYDHHSSLGAITPEEERAIAMLNCHNAALHCGIESTHWCQCENTDCPYNRWAVVADVAAGHWYYCPNEAAENEDAPHYTVLYWNLPECIAQQIAETEDSTEAHKLWLAFQSSK